MQEAAVTKLVPTKGRSCWLSTAAAKAALLHTGLLYLVYLVLTADCRA
jgi:hypothetical protein